MRRIHYDDLRQLALPLKHIPPFVKVPGMPASKLLESNGLEQMLRSRPLRDVSLLDLDA